MLKKPDIYNVDDILYSLKYSENELKEKNYGFKMKGQLKLLLSEIRFLTEEVEIQNLKEKHFTLLYIGSGKGYHIPLLINLYENYDIDWVFFDPSGHCEKLHETKRLSKKKITIRDEYFLDNDINEFKDIENLLFISDIRSTESSKEEIVTSEPTTKNLLFDYDLQNRIIKELKPMFSLLKFRMPFPNDWEAEYSFEKPIGKECLQAFTKPSSTEFRIFLNSIITFEKIENIDELKKYEERFSWYNRIYRIEKENDLNIAYYIFSNYYKTELVEKKIKRKDIVKFLKTIQKSY